MFTTLTNQNDVTDWFGYLNNRLAAGLEYTATVLLNQSVTYDSSFYRCDANLLGGPWTQVSSAGLWPLRPIWELGYAIYASRGVSLPNVKALIEGFYTPDGQSPATAIADGSAFQTLRYRPEGSDLSATITG
jgi:hypothetical protein